jgi:ferredoxin
MGTSKTLRVSIDKDRCQGHNRCCVVAPELFDADDMGNGCVRGDGIVEPALEAKARLAMANCPEHAIRVAQK